MRVRIPPALGDRAPLPRRDLGRTEQLKCFRGDTLRNTLPALPPHPPANGYEPRKVPQSFILAGWRWLPGPGWRGERARSRPGLLHHPWEKFPSGAKTYGRRRPMGPRRKILAEHSAANPVPPAPAPGMRTPLPAPPPGWQRGEQGKGTRPPQRAGAPRIPPAGN